MQVFRIQEPEFRIHRIKDLSCESGNIGILQQNLAYLKSGLFRLLSLLKPSGSLILITDS